LAQHSGDAEAAVAAFFDAPPRTTSAAAEEAGLPEPTPPAAVPPLPRSVTSPGIEAAIAASFEAASRGAAALDAPTLTPSEAPVGAVVGSARAVASLTAAMADSCPAGHTPDFLRSVRGQPLVLQPRLSEEDASRLAQLTREDARCAREHNSPRLASARSQRCDSCARAAAGQPRHVRWRTALVT
jgi:hypothetical protein